MSNSGQESRAPLRQQQSEQTTGQRQQQALDQQLPDDPDARTAERRPHGKFFPARGRSSQQQVRDIRTGDQQYEANRAEKNQQCRSDIASYAFLQRDHIHAISAGVGDWMLTEQLLRYRVHLSARLFDGDALLEPADHVSGSAHVSRLPILWTHQHPKRRRPLMLEALRHYANYCIGTIVEDDRLANDVLIAGELALPKTVAENGDGIRSRLLVITADRASQHRRYTHNSEIVGRYHARIQIERPVCPHQRHGPSAKS